MVVTNTQDDFKIRAIDVVHINPSIMEGERNHSSLLGPRSAVPIVRFAPTFITQPSVSGLLTIPSVLTCNPGTITASPTADLFFQWQADGVDIVGETNSTLVTSLAFDNVLVTCNVDAVNYLGTASSTSSGITPERVEPIINHQHLIYALQGLGQEYNQNMNTEISSVATGLPSTNRIDSFSNSSMSLTGLGSVDGLDAQTSRTVALTGLGADGSVDNISSYIYEITGLQIENTQASYESEALSMWQPEYMSDLAIINPGAESQDMTGWTTTLGTIIATDTETTSGMGLPPAGSWFFTARNTNGTGPLTNLNIYDTASMYQTVLLDSGILSDVDASHYFYDVSALMSANYTASWGPWNAIYLTCTCEDAIGTVLDTVQFDFDDVRIYKSPTNTATGGITGWQPVYQELKPLPVNTRQIKIVVTMAVIQTGPTRSDIDDIRVRFYRDKR